MSCEQNLNPDGIMDMELGKNKFNIFVVHAIQTFNKRYFLSIPLFISYV